MKPNCALERPLVFKIKKELKTRASAAHVPQVIADVPALPMTFNNKRSERAATDAANGKPVSNLRVWKGESRDVAAGFVTDQYLTLPKGKADKLALSMIAVEPLVAPVSKGQRLGTVRVALEGKTMAEFPLVALDDVPIANIFNRAWDTIRLWFQ